MSRMLSKMNLISVVQQLPKEDIETIQGYVEMIEEENQELKQKYLNAVADYETTMAENKELKKQLEEYIKQNMKLKDELFDKRKEYQDTYKDVRIEIKEYKTQQKEFIKFLEDNYKETQDIWYIKILQKYKSIIGVSDEKEN